MAEEQKVILEIQVNNDKAIASIVEQKRVIEQLQYEQKQLDKTSEEGKKANEAYTAVIKQKTDQLRRTEKSVVDSTKAMQAEAGSIEANRAKLAQLTAEYIKLGKPTADQTKAIKDLSDTLKSQESAIGNNTRNVGNYREALGNLGGGVGKAITGIQGFNTALSANPIGAVVSLINMLVNALKGNAEVADFVERAMAGLNKMFQLVVDTIVSFGQSLGKAFSNPKQAILDLITLIKENLLNRFKAFGVIARGIADGDLKAVANGFIQMGTGVEDAIGKVQKVGKALGTAGEEGFNAAKKLDEFAKSQAELTRQSRLNSVSIEALEKDLKNVGLTLERRKKIASELADLEIKNARIAQTAAKQILDIEKEKLKGKTLNGEEEARLITMQADFEVAKKQEIAAAANRSKRIALLLKKEEVEGKKALNNEEVKNEEKKLEELRKGQEEYDKYLEDRAKKEAKAAEQLVQYKKELQIEDAKNLEEKLQLELELAQQKFDADLEANDYTKSELALREAKYLEEIADLNDKYAEDSKKKKKELMTWEKMNEQQKADTVLGIMGNFQKGAALLGEEGKAIQKALGISSAIIETYKGASLALGTYAFPLGPIIAASTVAAGLANVASIAAAAGGGDFVTTKPTLLLVGDNPGGRERVTVEPLSGRGQTKIGNSGLIAMAGGGSLTVNPSGMSAISSTASNDVFNQMALSKSITDSFSKLGNPVVSVVDIKKVSNKTTVTENKARLRA